MWVCFWLQSIHMFLRESSKRRQFERQRRMKAQTRKLQAEQYRSSSLLLNMLPYSIVKQLVRQRVEPPLTCFVGALHADSGTGRYVDGLLCLCCCCCVPMLLLCFRVIVVVVGVVVFPG